MSEQESGKQDIPAAPEAEATETQTDVEPAAPLSAEELNTRLVQAEDKIAQQQDQLLRSQAETENLKRRHTQALEKAHKFGTEKIVSDLLGVWDSLELGLQAAQDEQADLAKLREGTELTLKMLTDAMQKQGVEQHDPQGDPFDPELHQAMSMQPRNDVAPDTVIQVVQKGYSLNGRLVRPAMVMVSQAMPESAPAE